MSTAHFDPAFKDGVIIEAAQSVRAIADIIADLKRSKNHPALRERSAASWRAMSAWHGHLADVLATRLTARGK